MKVDAFIPCAPKDLFRLKIVLNYLTKYVNEINNIHICTPTKISPLLLNISNKIYYHVDTDILPDVNPYNWKFRPNWVFQQFLKLFQNVTSTEYFYTIDSDTVIIKPLSLFENEKPIWYRGYDQGEASSKIPVFSQYINFNRSIFPEYNENLHKHTFIGDMCLFNRKIIEELLLHINLDKNNFIKKSQEISNVQCHISESELYGYYIFAKHPDMYVFKKLNQKQAGKFQVDPYACNWTPDEVKQIINQAKQENFDTISMHSGCITSHNWNDKDIILT